MFTLHENEFSRHENELSMHCSCSQFIEYEFSKGGDKQNLVQNCNNRDSKG